MSLRRASASCALRLPRFMRVKGSCGRHAASPQWHPACQRPNKCHAFPWDLGGTWPALRVTCMSFDRQHNLSTSGAFNWDIPEKVAFGVARFHLGLPRQRRPPDHRRSTKTRDQERRTQPSEGPAHEIFRWVPRHSEPTTSRICRRFGVAAADVDPNLARVSARFMLCSQL